MKRTLIPFVRTAVAVLMLLCPVTGAWAVAGGTPQDDQAQPMDAPASGAVIYPPLDGQPEAIPQDNALPQDPQEQAVQELPNAQETTLQEVQEVQEVAPPADGGDVKPPTQ